MIDLPGLQWVLVFTATPAFVEAHAINRALPGLLIGFLLTALLLWYLYTNVRHNISLESTIAKLKQTEEAIQQTNKNLAILLKISKTLTATLNIDTVMQNIIDSATNLIGLDTGAIYLIDGDKLYLGAATPPITPQFPDEFRHALIEDHPHIYQSVSTSMPVILPDMAVADLSPAEQTIRESRNMRTLLYVPLLIEKHAVGVLIL
ncbi:GAF domain-containing protein, partial [bacterium]|nr:GAF domain-containing protein [bacterium]